VSIKQFGPTFAMRRIVPSVKPVLCLDLDGTIRYSKSGLPFIQDENDIALFADVEAKLWDYKDRGYVIAGISNQGGVAFGKRTAQDVDNEVKATLALFSRDPFDSVQCCLCHPNGFIKPYNTESMFRKPNPGMLATLEEMANSHGIYIDWPHSLFVGDRPEDQECARRGQVPFLWAWEFFSRDDPSAKDWEPLKG